LEEIEAMIETYWWMLVQKVIVNFGDEEDTWLGRGEPSVMGMMSLMAPPVTGSEAIPDAGGRTVMDVIAGRFLRLQRKKEYGLYHIAESKDYDTCS
jgi:hypothetical protein